MKIEAEVEQDLEDRQLSKLKDLQLLGLLAGCGEDEAKYACLACSASGRVCSAPSARKLPSSIGHEAQRLQWNWHEAAPACDSGVLTKLLCHPCSRGPAFA